MKLINFEDIFAAQPPDSSIILVEGVAGTLKSGLCFSIMLDMLRKEDSYGVYLTFEQTWKSHVNNMKSLGLNAPENLLVSDYNIMRQEFKDEETQVKIFDSIIEMLTAIQQEKGSRFKVFTLDSLNAIYSIMEEKYLQSSLLAFFKRLRDLNIITLIIFEKSPDNTGRAMRERFLADGIISMGIMQSRGEMVRYLQPLKLTSIDHSLKKRQVSAGKDGMVLLGPVYR